MFSKSGVPYFLILVSLFLCCNEKTTTGTLSYVTFVHSESVVVENSVGKYDSIIVGITAKISPVPTAEVQIPLIITGNADSTDYKVVTPRLIFPAGSDSCRLNVIVYNSDRLDEPAEAITFTMQLPPTHSAGDKIVHTLMFRSVPKVETVHRDRARTRKSGSYSFEVSLDRKSAEVITIPYKVRGTALAPALHNMTDGVLTFNPGDTLNEKTVTLINDSLITGTRTIVIDVQIPANAVSGEKTSDSVTILYDRVVKFQLADNALTPWKQSRDDSDLRVAEGDGLYWAINGGATEYVDLGYQCALIQKMVAPDSSNLRVTSMLFSTTTGVDSIMSLKKQMIGSVDIVSLPGYTIALVLGSTGPGNATYYIRNGTYYFEIVLSAFATSALANAAAKTVTDWLVAQSK